MLSPILTIHAVRRLIGRLIAWFSTLVLISGWIGCTAPGAPEDKILIEFWDFPRLPAVQVWLDNAIRDYMRQHPDVHIEYTRLSWSKGTERLDIAAFAGRPPDVAGAVMNLKYQQAGLLAPVDRYLDEEIPGTNGTLWRDDIHPAVLRAVQWEGQTWAFPWYKEGFVMVLNRDIFAERGVELPEGGQWTWEEFLEKMTALTFKRDGVQVYGVGFNTGREKWEAWPFLFAEGMQLISADGRRMLIDSPETRAGIQRLYDLEHTYRVAMPGAGGYLDDTTWSAFTGKDRRLAAVCQGVWSLKAVEISNQRRADAIARDPTAAKDLPPELNIAVALYPRIPGRPQIMASYGVGSYMVFNRPHDPRRTEAAARFARWLTLEVGQRICREAGVLPSRRSTGNLFAGDPRYEPLMPYWADSISPPVHPVWNELARIIDDQLSLALLGQKSIDEAVRAMQDRCQIVLDDYWRSADAAVN
ncbi:MAG: sugar ABC transporter substrate-binding protein [Candidatus Sumerlaeia bacterium]